MLAGEPAVIFGEASRGPGQGHPSGVPSHCGTQGHTAMGAIPHLEAYPPTHTSCFLPKAFWGMEDKSFWRLKFITSGFWPKAGSDYSQPPEGYRRSSAGQEGCKRLQNTFWGGRGSGGERLGGGGSQQCRPPPLGGTQGHFPFLEPCMPLEHPTEKRGLMTPHRGWGV